MVVRKAEGGIAERSARPFPNWRKNFAELGGINRLAEPLRNPGGKAEADIPAFGDLSRP